MVMPRMMFAAWRCHGDGSQKAEKERGGTHAGQRTYDEENKREGETVEAMLLPVRSLCTASYTSYCSTLTSAVTQSPDATFVCGDLKNVPRGWSFPNAVFACCTARRRQCNFGRGRSAGCRPGRMHKVGINRSLVP